MGWFKGRIDSSHFVCCSNPKSSAGNTETDQELWTVTKDMTILEFFDCQPDSYNLEIVATYCDFICQNKRWIVKKKVDLSKKKVDCQKKRWIGPIRYLRMLSNEEKRPKW